MADASFPVCWLEVWPSDSGLVSLHRSHYLKSSALKQKVRDQQILTSGQAYDSILMQFPSSSSLIITLLSANLISHLSNFRHISSASNFAKLHWQNIWRAAFPKELFSLCFCLVAVGVRTLNKESTSEQLTHSDPPRNKLFHQCFTKTVWNMLSSLG